MSFFVHQIVGVIANPLGMTFVLLLLGAILVVVGRRRMAGFVLFANVVLVMVMGTPFLNDRLLAWLEGPFPPVRAEMLPAADAVVILGGGVSGIPKGSTMPYPSLHEGADRVWHGARIWHAKGGKIYCTCPDVSTSTPPFLKDLGVPEDCIVPFDGPRNTEEEARRYEVELPGKSVYLVTSATHMRRALKIFRKFAPHVEVVPAATDHILVDNPESKVTWRSFVPNFNNLTNFGVVLHELLGLVRYAF